MLHKLKPVPRFLLIAVVLGAVGYGVTKIDFPAKSEAPVAGAEPAPTVTTVTPPAPNAAPAPVVATPTPTPVPAPAAAEDSGLKPAGGQDAGLDAVMKAGKK